MNIIVQLQRSVQLQDDPIIVQSLAVVGIGSVPNDLGNTSGLTTAVLVSRSSSDSFATGTGASETVTSRQNGTGIQNSTLEMNEEAMSLVITKMKWAYLPPQNWKPLLNMATCQGIMEGAASPPTILLASCMNCGMVAQLPAGGDGLGGEGLGGDGLGGGGEGADPHAVSAYGKHQYLLLELTIELYKAKKSFLLQVDHC